MNKKILVIGSPGSGKSYFSKELAKILNIPVYHLDLLYWNENWVSTPKEEFDSKLKEIMKQEQWIIDGNYQRTLEIRLNKANIVYFLDLPAKVCVEAEKARRGIPRSDFPSFLNEGEDPEFVNYIKEFPKNNKPVILELLKKYDNLEIKVIKSRIEMNKHLKELEKLA